VAAKLGLGEGVDLFIDPVGEFSLFGAEASSREHLFGVGFDFDVEESYQSTSLN
jgi:hypothetical protein